MAIMVLSESELRRCVALDAALIDAIADAFRRLVGGGVVMPPVLHVDLPAANAEVDVKTAFLPGLKGFAIKVSPGFFDNTARGLPSLSGMMMLLSTETGRPLALHLDNGYLTDLRTAAAGAVAARYLARDRARTAGLVGAGLQARLQLEALTLVRPIERAWVWARDPGKVETFADQTGAALGLEILPAASVERLVLESDVVITATPARDPLITADWLHPGLHVTAMGTDAPAKNELHPEVLARADLVVCDWRSQCERLGELHHALELGLTIDTIDLGELVAGHASGRTDDDQVTVADLTGTGVQDTAIAVLAYERARAAGLGFTIEG